MPSITYDGRSFMLDGRRQWIVSGSIHSARVPPESWADRIHAARLAGLNTIETPVFWSRCEPRPGQFDFDGGNDIRRFIELIGEAGMKCILRPGPFVGEGWDLGGFPAWLPGIEGVEHRRPSQPLLEACSRYFSALADQVKDLQVTAAGNGGPIILIQNECKWTCDDPVAAAGYLGELNRYLRESGLTVPKINANNLWQGVEGEIDCWSGEGDMLATTRQLATVRPDQPRLMIDFGPKKRACFGAPEPEPVNPVMLQRQLTEILAGGGQYNISPFCSGTSDGFWAGQAHFGEHTFYAPDFDAGAPIDEVGAPRATYAMVRRVSTFASQFGRVLAHLDPEYQPVVLDPGSLDRGEARGPVVAHATGSQGSIAFILADDSSKRATQPIELLMPDGSAVPVELGRQRVAWCLFGVHLGARSTLDYCTLNAFASVRDVFVCFGPAGSTGHVSINGSPLDVPVPKGRKPLVAELEGVTVVACNEDLIDETYISDHAVYVGVAGLDADGEPIASSAGKQFIRIMTEGGETKTISSSSAGGRSASGAPRPAKLSVGEWSSSPATQQAAGDSPRYAAIPGPAELTMLGSPYGYGWYRVTVKSNASRKVRLALPESGDRTQVLLDGEPLGTIGRGPGAELELPLQLKKGQHSLVLLADNMGRASGGTSPEPRKGVWGEALEISPYRIGKGKIVSCDPVEPLAHRSPIFGLRQGDATHPSRLTWSFQHRKRTPIIAKLEQMPTRCIIFLNDEIVRVIDADAPCEVVLSEEETRRGGNVLQFAVLNEWIDDAFGKKEAERLLHEIEAGCTFLEGTAPLAKKGGWAFAKWEPPAKTTFKAVPKTGRAGPRIPTWWKAKFDAPKQTDAPLILGLEGMTKGQVYLNGVHVGRYFVSTASGKKVPPIESMLLPASALKKTGNELMLFDEHGGNARKCTLSYDSSRRSIIA